MKKGISPTVGIVLLILMVVIIGGIVFVWARDFTLDNKAQAMGEKMCRDVELAVGDFCYKTLGVLNDVTRETEIKTYIKFSGRNDFSGLELYGFLIFLDYGGDTTLLKSTSISSLAYSEMETGISKDLKSDFINNVLEVERIIIVPKIRVDETVFTCTEKDTVMFWRNIEECST